ncbi:MAG TPA: hypothetical protein VNZ52_15480 [Candidatus Thermoplasmatota archaeon]|nr:hypothetical protein [Candidatus Thermoplasmatota archaeon]
MNPTDVPAADPGTEERFPFLRPVPTAGLLCLAGDELETVSLEAIQMWMRHFRERLAEAGSA